MRIWTIQTIPAWNILRRTKVLRLVDRRKCDPDLVHAYGWMASQMRKRLPHPAHLKSLPLWGWHTWQGARAKPDLRARGLIETGKRAVRLTLEKNPKQVLLSDFMLWHFVLNGSYIPASLADDERFENTYEQQAALSSRDRRKRASLIEKSWEKIFDLDWRAEGITDPKSRRSLQATFWEINLEEVVDVTHFTGR